MTEPTLVQVTCAKCIRCGNAAVVTMTAEQYEQMNRPHAALRLIFPTWSRSDLELLITGMHSACWESMFAEDDDDDDD